jgi:hypothetical protein
VSHFLCLVLVAREAADIRAEVDRLLAPYSERERKPVRSCYCLPAEAERRARAAADERVGRRADLMKRFRERKAAMTRNPEEPLREHNRKVHAIYKELLTPWQVQHRSSFKHFSSTLAPLPDCARCKGSGSVTVGPRDSKWDDWVIGGRWAGVLRRGTRREEMETEESEEDEAEDLARDVRPVAELLPLGDLRAFAVVTPDGEWCEEGRLMAGERVVEPDPTWHSRLARLFDRHRDALVVACDCHI